MPIKKPVKKKVAETGAIVLTEDALVRKVKVSNDLETEERKSVLAFVENLTDKVPLASGFLPPGLVSYRQAGGRIQIVLQMPPAVNQIMWGYRERDPNAKVYALAQPYRIIMGVYENGAFIGARQFYSPEPINDFDAPLYHANVPNINCRGYNGTTVGWICLYHRDNTTKYDLAEQVRYLALRASGNEAYNDANMSETDGARFYKEHKAGHRELWDPTAWEKKTEKDGVLWTLNDKLWIPVTVQDADHQDAHKRGGEPLTLRMALEGDGRWYYHDQRTSIMNDLVRDDRDVTDAKVNEKILLPAAVATPTTTTNQVKVQAVKKSEPLSSDGLGPHASDPDLVEAAKPPKAKIQCGACGHSYEEGSVLFVPSADYGSVCAKCAGHFYACTTCEQNFHKNHLYTFEGALFCGEHNPGTAGGQTVAQQEAEGNGPAPHWQAVAPEQPAAPGINKKCHCGHQWSPQAWADPDFVNSNGCSNCLDHFTCPACHKIKISREHDHPVTGLGHKVTRQGIQPVNGLCAMCAGNADATQDVPVELDPLPDDDLDLDDGLDDDPEIAVAPEPPVGLATCVYCGAELGDELSNTCAKCTNVIKAAADMKDNFKQYLNKTPADWTQPHVEEGVVATEAGVDEEGHE